MQKVSINDVTFPIAPYHAYFLIVTMDTVMGNAEGQYQ